MGRSRSAFAFSLVELLVVISLITVLVSLGVAGASRAMRSARATKCLTNLRQIGMASLSYAAENQGEFPQSSHQGPARAWTVVLKDALPADIFKSPLDDTSRTCSYAINDYLTEKPYGAKNVNFSRLQNVPCPSQTLLMAVLSRHQANADHFHFADPEVGAGTEGFASEIWVDLIDEASHYLFVDGHVQRLSWQDVQAILRQPGSCLIRPDGASPQ